MGAQSPVRVGIAPVVAGVWLLVVVLIALHQWQFWRSPQVDTNVFSLLPHDAGSPLAEQATRQLAHLSERRVVVLIGAPRWSQARTAARRYAQAVAAQDVGLRRVADGAAAEALMGFFEKSRNVLLTDQQRRELSGANNAQRLQLALARLLSPSSAEAGAWLSDPLGLWPAWWIERAGFSAARMRDGWLWLDDTAGHQQWAVLQYATAGTAFAMDGQQRWTQALERARQSAQAGADAASIRVVAAGVPLQAEAGAASGMREMNMIGWGGLLAVALLVWWAFLALRPLLLLAVSLLIGCAAGLSATVLLFGEVHVLTLVFGASLVGVAEDYGIHYFASRLSAPTLAPSRLMRRLLPGLSLALVTSVLGYLVLGAVALPGLRQMAIFSAAGLSASFLSTVCWFPILDRSPVRASPMSMAVSAGLARWPRLHGAPVVGIVMVFIGLGLLGVMRLHVLDDVRQLQAPATGLIDAQREVGRLLRLPSPAQYFIVRGRNQQEVLEREEALKDRLHGLLSEDPAEHTPLRLSALSDWVPSHRRQAENRQLSLAVEGPIIEHVAKLMGEDLQRPAFASHALELDAWLAGPAPPAVTAQWLGKLGREYASIVVIAGLSDGARAEQLHTLGETVRGVSWEDRTAALSRLLGQFRITIGGLLVAGHALVLLALSVRYGRQAWRAWLPTALASVGCLAILGFRGEGYQLFHGLALVLLLGVGVDYGIFLLESAGRDQGYAWLAVLLGAASTGFSFGLLALSSVPALHAFGATLFMGLVLVCLLTPLFRLAGCELQTRSA